MNFTLDFIAIAKERDELRRQVQRLQIALNFWMPGVPVDDPEIAKRAAEDAHLLAGLDVPNERSAEEIGWLALRQPPTSTAGKP